MLTKEQKKIIRQEIKFAKQQLTTAERNNAEQSICKQLANDINIANCRNIAIYHALPDELPTSQIITTLRELGHNIYLPVITDNNIIFRLYDVNTELQEEQKFGIAEPTSSPQLSLDEPFVIITPGIAFTPDGIRLGRGGGFYDRFFVRCASNNCNIHKIGIAYKCQKRQTLPFDTLDVKVDYVYFG